MPKKLVATAIGLIAIASSAIAAENHVRVFTDDDQRCITSNGVPNHAIGEFPNRGNPHSFEVQDQRFCFDKTPQKTSSPTRGTPNVGIALNGILIRPGTADWYDGSSPRGFSRDGSSGWNLEGMGSRDSLGMDRNNAHVDHRGLYHYHGAPVGSLKTTKNTHIGYATDGFEIHYVGAQAKSSWQLKPGTRPTGPGGRHDGRFIQDWKFVAGSGTLDQCNGGMRAEKHVYFSTDNFPFYPRCHWGDVSSDFEHRGPPRGGRGNFGMAPDHGRSFGNRPRKRLGSPSRPGTVGGPLAAAAATLGISEQALAEAVGRPPPNVQRASKILGIPADKIRAALRRHRPR
jgi:hypothetical protein